MGLRLWAAGETRIPSQSSGKLEKAEILEMTVQYLRALHSADFPRGREKGKRVDYRKPWAGNLRSKTPAGREWGEGTSYLLDQHYQNGTAQNLRKRWKARARVWRVPS